MKQRGWLSHPGQSLELAVLMFQRYLEFWDGAGRAVWLWEEPPDPAEPLQGPTVMRCAPWGGDMSHSMAHTAL